jgi:hypothetical protein
MNDIILGDGVFAIGATSIALTRGGGKLSIKRDFKQIEADGDYGAVKGRIRKIKSVATLSMNALEMLATNLSKMYPALNIDSATTVGTDTITGKVDIADTDYQDTVTWTGKTTGGRGVVITLKNAINLEGIEWDLKDKDEVVPELTYTATFDPASRTIEPWSVKFVDAV